jgi:hypothetical protein
MNLTSITSAADLAKTSRVELSIHEESIARMKALTFGEPVTNICAGENNPHLHSFFVAYVVDSRRNRWGLVHKSHWAKCTDKKGSFWKTGIDVIHPGTLDAETRTRLFAPVWEKNYGAPPTGQSQGDPK